MSGQIDWFSFGHGGIGPLFGRHGSQFAPSEIRNSVLTDPIAMSYLRLTVAESGILGHLPFLVRDRTVVDRIAAWRTKQPLSATGLPVLNAPLATFRLERGFVHLGTRATDFGACPCHWTHRILRKPKEIDDLFQDFQPDQDDWVRLRRLAAAPIPDVSRSMTSEAGSNELDAFLSDGRLIAIRCQPATGNSSGTEKARELAPFPIAETLARRLTKPLPAAQKIKTWIQIELHDQDGKPVPNERYRIELPDGSAQEGALDENGCAGVDGIDPGRCKVSFPDIHAKEWHAA